MLTQIFVYVNMIKLFDKYANYAIQQRKHLKN